MAKAEGKSFDFLDHTHIDTKALEVFAFEFYDQEILTVTKEFSAVCPFSGLPDIATVRIRYYPTDLKCIELKSLKYYLTSFRNVGIYQEAVTARISNDLGTVLGTKVEVVTIYNTRGGFDTVCIQNKLHDYVPAAKPELL